MSDYENDDVNISINFVGHAEDEVIVGQYAYGLKPALTVETEIDGDDVVFNVNTYGLGDDEHREFLETIIEVLNTVVKNFGEDLPEGD